MGQALYQYRCLALILLHVVDHEYVRLLSLYLKICRIYLNLHRETRLPEIEQLKAGRSRRLQADMVN